MIVTIISQCEKKALNRTRRVLDAFANRIGDNVWQTVITQEGLNAVKKLLRKTASKNTAVSCHWIRGRVRTELLWVVGNKRKFNSEGMVPVNRTQRNLLKSKIESDWHYLPLIKSLVALAALFHDWGKATALFQQKLKPKNKQKFKGDPIRHEWISILLLNAFIQTTDSQSDSGWLLKLKSGDINEELLKQYVKQNVPNPFSKLPPLAKLLAWLIVSHHRLPLPNKDSWNDYISEGAESLHVMLSRISLKWGYENRFDEAEYNARIAACFDFPKGLLVNSKPWIKQVQKWSVRLLDCQKQAENSIQDGSYRVVLNHARLSLMLGDHYYSSQNADQKWQGQSGLFANTDRSTKTLKQKLDEHLVGVARHALNTAHLLPSFEKEPPCAEDIKNLKARSPSQFRWQDVAVEKINSWQKENFKKDDLKYGFFAVNMASTGCGKTFANAKIMRILSHDSESLRYILALGLRTLTLQTGDEYRQRVGLDNSELAVLIGSRAVMELHKQIEIDNEENSYENTGSLSQEALLEEEIDFECAIPEDGLSTVLTCNRDKKFLYAPVLVATIDHLMAATETKRGGRYILPTLRLMSSDLVIDEIDDFTGDDLIAIGRLIHLAGILGRKVMISSATIPPFLAEGYFKAYRDGWDLYCKSRTANRKIGCAWIDEFSTQVFSNDEMDVSKSVLENFRPQHAKFINKRVKKLKQQPAKRKAIILDCQMIVDQFKDHNPNTKEVLESKQSAYFNVVVEGILNLHEAHNYIDKKTNLKVSFGVVRVANISPCVELTRYLGEIDWPDNTEIRVMAYHSQQVLLLRSEQEKHLDQVLTRKEKEKKQPNALSNLIIRKHLNNAKNNSKKIKNVIFILVATPVEEVGRDHDFDWAVIEPSSYRSIIQLAGRVRRHRQGEVSQPNLSLLQFNLKGLQNYHDENAVVFSRPGFEDFIRLKSHDLRQLVDVDAIYERLDAIPRIQCLSHLNINYLRSINQADNLVELEHAATWFWLANYKMSGQGAQTSPATLQGWLNHQWFLSALPQVLSPFRKGQPSLKIILVFNESQQSSQFCEKNTQGYAVERENLLNIKRVELSERAKSRLWLIRDYGESCLKLAEQKGTSQRSISLRYGELNFPFYERNKYGYNDELGLFRLR